MTFAYYPGCSLEASSEAYDISARAVCERLGIELQEIPDWNCCGATEASALGYLSGHALVARNLALVDKSLKDVVAPCASCFLNLKKTDKLMKEDRKIGGKLAEALEAGGLAYEPGSLRIRHLLEVVHRDIGHDRIQQAVVRPLTGLRIAPYYGCQVVRPVGDSGDADDPEQPQAMDELFSWLGATVVDYPVKAHCCGGHMTQISTEMSNELLRRLLYTADEHQADIIVCACPMCQLNLDAYQGKVNNAFNTAFDVPILFFSQLLGLALGIEADALGFGKEIIDSKDVLAAKLDQEETAETPSAPRRTRRVSRSLPMPKKD
jgi:heterodisulfide reductase subunit B2